MPIFVACHDEAVVFAQQFDQFIEELFVFLLEDLVGQLVGQDQKHSVGLDLPAVFVDLALDESGVVEEDFVLVAVDVGEEIFGLEEVEYVLQVVLEVGQHVGEVFQFEGVGQFVEQFSIDAVEVLAVQLFALCVDILHECFEVVGGGEAEFYIFIECAEIYLQFFFKLLIVFILQQSIDKDSLSECFEVGVFLG